MPATVAGIHLGPDAHANRPAANAAGLPVGAFYYCTDHSLLYQTDGSSWSTYLDNSATGGASAIDDLSDVDTDKSKTPADGDVLTFDGTDWNAETPAAAGSTIDRDFNVLTNGNKTVSGTSFTDVDNALDCTVAAVAGDVLMATLGALVQASGSIYMYTGFEVVNSGTVFRSGSNYVSLYSADAFSIAAVAYHTVVSGDISGGNVTVRLQAYVPSSSRYFYASSDYPLTLGLVNLGQ